MGKKKDIERQSSCHFSSFLFRQGNFNKVANSSHAGKLNATTTTQTRKTDSQPKIAQRLFGVISLWSSAWISLAKCVSMFHFCPNSTFTFQLWPKVGYEEGKEWKKKCVCAYVCVRNRSRKKIACPYHGIRKKREEKGGQWKSRAVKWGHNYVLGWLGNNNW